MSPSFCSPQICSNITFPEVSFLFVCCHKDVLMLRFCSDTTTTWLLWGKDPGFSIKSWFCRHQQAGTYQVTSNKYWNSATDSVLRLLDLWMWQRATETDKSEHKRVFQKHINANFFILAPNVFLKEHLCPEINLWLLKPTAPLHSSSGLYVFMSWWWICNDPSLLITNRKQPHVAEGVSHVIMFELAASLLAFSVTFELIWTAE